ncbi:Ig-like domain-containing protein [Halapricum salinum]|uniref:Big-1 domain-containing protein n=1 Tax=Halapricum salinum TaxID=1457250 RepID=A0A4D6HDC8_9EURY|nr:hypothetical protein [Halapricum salinum]QCC51216.1 hypothetical protein DV733_08150 [Halapricum salinum]
MKAKTHISDRQFRHDDRGVSEVLGAILVFALLILLLVLIQVNAVPAANEQVEFEHNQRVVQDFQSLQDGLFRTSATGQEAAIPVETGISYPPRFFLLNPGPATGTIRTTGQQPLTIENAQSSGNVGDFWTGDRRTYATTGLAYRPDYNELQSAGTLHLEHSMVYRNFEGGNRYFDDPTSFIDGNRIRLTLLTGNVSRGGLSTSVELAPISHQRRTITIEDDGDPITIEFQTELDTPTLRNEIFDVNTTRVEKITKTGNTATMILEDGTYELTMSKIRVGSSSVEQPDAAYITDIDGNNTAVAEGTSLQLSAEVRDSFNNPVSDVDVTGTIESGPGSLEPTGTIQTDSEGKVTFQYDAPENVDGAQTVEALVEIGDGSGGVATERRVRFDLTIVDSDQSGSDSDDSSSDVNPYGPNTVQLEDAVIVENDRGTSRGNDDVQVIQVTFSNTHTDKDIDIDRARLVMYASRNQQGGGHARGPPAKALVYDTEESVGESYELIRSGDYAVTNVSDSDKLDSLTRNGGQQTYTFEMVDNSGDNFEPLQGEWFSLVLEFDDQRVTYLITPRL